MPCHLRYTIYCVLLHGTIGFVISLIVLAPFYFSTKWSEKYTIEKVIMIGFPCVGAFLGLIDGQRGVDPEASRRVESARRLERQQRSSRVSESAPRPKSPQIRNQPTRTVMMQRVLSHVLPPIDIELQDLEAQVLATGQSASDTSDLTIPRPAALAPTAQNSNAWTTYLSTNSESSTFLPPYAVLDPENPALPAPSYSRSDRPSNSRYDRPSRPTQELGPLCRICQTRHSTATNVNNSDSR